MKSLDLLSGTQIGQFWSKVTKTQTCWLWTATVSGGGYGRMNARGTSVYAHRVAFEMAGHVIPDGYDVDHVCRNRRCVRPDHLRVVTRSENNENFGSAHSHGRSGIRGVSWSKRARKWRVSVVKLGHQYHGGFYTNLADAEVAAIALRNQIFTFNEVDRMKGM